MPTHTFEVKITHNFSPRDIAEMFCNMDAEDMAYFFNHIDRISATWETPFCWQLAAVEKCTALEVSGRHIMRTIGEYAERQPTT